MLDFPNNPLHNASFVDGDIKYWFDQNIPGWQRAPVTTLPPMSLNSISPTFAMVNTANVLLTATGTSFPPDATILIDGVIHLTTVVSETSLTTTLTPSAAPGEHQVTVKSVSMNKTTAPVTFTWAAVMALISLSPEAAVIGDNDTFLNVVGAAFVPDCEIKMNNIALPTTFVSSTELMTTLQPSTITVGGPAPVTVYSAVSMQTTPALNFDWKFAPVLTSMTPTTATVVGVTANLVVTGEHFSSVAGEETVIYQDSKALPNTVVASAISCSVTIVAPATPTTEMITVMNGIVPTNSPPLPFVWT